MNSFLSDLCGPVRVMQACEICLRLRKLYPPLLDWQLSADD